MKRVLIVDDSAFMRLTIKNTLPPEEYDVVGEAENSQEAIQKYKELNPDIVTMDIIMPVESGLLAVKNIMQHDPVAKILMVSAIGQEQIIQEAINIGAKGFIIKPFKKEELLGALKKLN